MAFTPKDQQRENLRKFLETALYDHKLHQITLAVRKEAEMTQAQAYWQAKEAAERSEGEINALPQPQPALEKDSFFEAWLDSIQNRLNSRAAELVAQLLSLLAAKVRQGTMSQKTADILGAAVQDVFQPQHTLVQQQEFSDRGTLDQLAPSAPLLSAEDRRELTALPPSISSRAHTTLRTRPRPSAPVFSFEDMPAMVHNKNVLRTMQLVNEVLNSGAPAAEVEQILEEAFAFLQLSEYQQCVDNYVESFVDVSTQYQSRRGYTECAIKHAFTPNMAAAAESFSVPDDGTGLGPDVGFSKPHGWRTQPSAPMGHEDDDDYKFGF